jgi:hypothetical protein
MQKLFLCSQIASKPESGAERPTFAPFYRFATRRALQTFDSIRPMPTDPAHEK